MNHTSERLLNAGLSSPSLAPPHRTQHYNHRRHGPISRHASKSSSQSASSIPPPPPLNNNNNSRKVDERYFEFLDEWDKGFMEANECREGCFLKVVYGAVPNDLEGTFFRNGPGKFTLGDRTIDHPYDGDGFVASIAFKNGRAFYRARFISTPEYEAEAAAEDVLFRGTFATQRSGGAMTNIGDLYIKNTSNTNVVSFGDKLWTLFEAGQPYSLDPWTLSTIGLELEYFKPGLPFDLGSAEANLKIADVIGMAQQRAGPSGIAAAAALPADATGAGGDAVTAHPHICPRSGRLVTFSYRVRPTIPSSLGGAPLATDFTFFELDGESMQPVVKSEYSLPGFAFLHDFVFTENFYIIFQNPVTVDNVPYVLGSAPAASCVRWVPGEATRVHIIPRPKPKPLHDNDKEPTTHKKPEAMVFSAPPFFVFHHANAFESAAGQRVTIDSIHYDSLPAVGREASAAQKLDPDAAFSSRLRRVEIDLATGVLRVSYVFQHYLEMPAINPRWFSQRHRFVYGYHSIFESPEIALAKVDVEGRQVDIWKPGKCKFALEPKFVPRKQSSTGSSINEEDDDDDEDDGWILAQLFDSEAMQSALVILDAKDLSKGPVAVVELKEPIPSALHSCWSDTCYYVNDGSSSNDYDDGEKEERNDENEQGRKWRGSGEQGRSMPSTTTTSSSNRKINAISILDN